VSEDIVKIRVLWLGIAITFAIHLLGAVVVITTIKSDVSYNTRHLEDLESRVRRLERLP